MADNNTPDQSMDDNASQEKTSSTSDEETTILSKIAKIFGQETVNRFEAEDITTDEAVQDLLAREADAPIFSKLGLTYGKVLQLRKAFDIILPHSTGALQVLKQNVKPTMSKLSSFSPENRSAYLTKRKNIGTLACEHWKGSFPRFNTPDMKAELARFSKEIAPTCAMPEIGFGVDGIQKHIQNYFNEQRRYKKTKSKFCSSCQEPMSPSLPEMPKSDESDDVRSPPPKKSKSSYRESHKSDDEASTPSTLSVASDVDDNGDDLIESSQMPQAPNTPVEVHTNSSAASNGIPNQHFNLKACQLIIKAVFGTQLTRDQLVKVLKKKFSTKEEHLTSLTILEVMQITAKKLLSNNYIAIDEKADIKRLRITDLQVFKEIYM